MTAIHSENRGVIAVDLASPLSKDEIGKISALLLTSCGNGPLLHIGSADLTLMQHFLSYGVHIVNVDPSGSGTSREDQNLADRFVRWSGDVLPFEDGLFSTVLITATPDNQNISAGFAEQVLRVSAANVFLYLGPQEPSEAPAFRKACESVFFLAGARKHPAYYRVNDYQSLQFEQGRVPIPLEKLPAKAALEYPVSALIEERDLHTDMTREPGSRSDAHIIRYMLAARYIRPGDRVLDAACGLGYGSQILLKCSDAQSVHGIDGSEYAIKYATLNFAEQNKELSFKEGWLPEALFDIPDNSIDLITSFETLEHVQDPKALLAEFYRVLTPSGRIVLSVPNDWSDETGEDPNPFHFHVYTWAKILEETEKHFLVEAAFAQTADQYKKDKQWAAGTRQLFETSVSSLATDDPECEWCLLVGMKTPLEGINVPYEETTYDQYPELESWQVTKLDSYQNPWLVKGLVTIGHRVNNLEMLEALSTEVIASAAPDSPDKGAGLCVLGYRLYDKAPNRKAIETFDAQCRAYLAVQPVSAQQLRWHVSLTYLLARFWQQWGEMDKAVAYFTSCTLFNCADYSPTLITKQIHAYRNLGLIESGRRNAENAKNYWRKAIESAEKALRIDWKNSYGSLDNPTEFGIHELGAIIECASSCAYALKHIEHSVSRTPQWWHQLCRDRESQLSHLDLVLKELVRLNGEVVSKDAHLSHAGHAVERLTAELATRNAHLTKTADTLGRLHTEIAEKDKRLDDVGHEVERVNAELAAKDIRLNEVGHIIELAKAELAAKDVRLNEVGHLVERVKAELAAKDIRLNEVGHEMERLKTELAAKDARLNEVEQVIEHVSAELAANDIRLGDVGRVIEQVNSEMVAKDVRLNELGYVIETLNAELAAKEAHVQEVGHVIERLNAEVAAKDAELHEAKLVIDHSNQMLMKNVSEMESLRQEISTLQNTIVRMEANDQQYLQKIRMQRLKAAMATRPLSLKAVAKIGFLTGSLLTPEMVRKRLRGTVRPVIDRFRAVRPAELQAPSVVSGYVVKQPLVKSTTRPVVVHVIANFMTGGSSRLVVDIYEHLGGDYDQRVLTSYAPQPPCYVGIPISEIHAPEDDAPFVAMFKELQPDFIHMHYWGDCDEIWYAKSMSAATTLGIPVIQNINTPVAPYHSPSIRLNVYVSDYVRNVFGSREHNNVTVYPGSDFALFEAGKKRRNKEDCIGMVYRLENDKLNSESILPFIRAVQKKPTIKVLIVGGGSLLEVFQAATVKEGVENNFEFTGYVAYEQLPAIYERMKLFVAPVWKESFGQVSPFAMNMRVPVVGFDIGAIGEIVEDPSLLAPPGDAEALADIIVSLLNDERRRVAIAERHRKRARDHFSIQAMIGGYKDIYSNVMAENK